MEAGKEFAKKHPQKARMLHLDDVRSRDPNVERLLESFAFLTSRIRKRLDDDFSQIADGLLSIIWPNYLNPVPSFCLLEFIPVNWVPTDMIRVPRFANVDSEPTHENIRCRFRTCFETTILPFNVDAASVDILGSTSCLKLVFSVFDNAILSQYVNEQIRVQLFGELLQCWQLYGLLLGKKGKKTIVESIQVELFNTEKVSIAKQTFNASILSPIGISEKESILATTSTTLWGYGLFRDFFIFPEKFQGFNLNILNFVGQHENTSTFTVSLHLSTQWPSSLRVAPEQFRLNTVPIVNLFEHDANPIRLDHLHHRYTVRGDIKYPEYFQVHSINRVEGLEVATGAKKKYDPLLSAKTDREPEQMCYFSVERELASWGGIENFISFKNAETNSGFPREEIISLSLTCTNGKLTSTLLPGQINNAVSDIDSNLSLRNISHPTKFVTPDFEKNSLWRWLSHASLNYVNLLSAANFRAMLQLHDFSNSEANSHRINGVTDISLRPIRGFFKGAIVPGNGVEITVNESHFSDSGEVQLFARILCQFLSCFASINSFVEVTVKVEPSQQKIVLSRELGTNRQL
ncbi:MAG: type VI secretion system baseplate subunit TssF [Deltaproteobacteria bacterium]|nr:type VI secretion system baseplate subunit TssF [Deltaproteobacteria bacterium]